MGESTFPSYFLVLIKGLVVAILMVNCGQSTIVYQNGSEVITWFNTDTGYWIENYNLTSLMYLMEFAQNCKINPPKSTLNETIFLILWQDAQSHGCSTLLSIFHQTDQLFDAKLVMLTSSFTNITHYNYYQQESETFGDVVSFGKSFLTLVTNETAHQLLSLPVGAMITVTSHPSEQALVLISTPIIASSWFLFTIFLIALLYSIYNLYLLRNQVFTTRFSAHLASAATCLFSDLCWGPYWTSYLGYWVFWGYQFYGFSVLNVIVLISWVKIASVHEIMPPFLIKILLYFLHSLIPIFFVIFTILILTFELQYQGTNTAELVLFLTLVTLIFTCIFVVMYFGIKMLKVVKRDLNTFTAKVFLIRKITVVMFLQSATYIILVVLLLVKLVLAFNPSYSALESEGLDLGFSSVVFLGLQSGFYFFRVQRQKEDHSAQSKENEGQSQPGIGTSTDFELTQN